MIDGQNFFAQLVRNDLITYYNIRKNAAYQGRDYTVGCLLYDNYFKNYYKMIEIDLRKQQALYADPKAIQEINFTGNIEQQQTFFFITEEAKKALLDFSQGTVKVF